MPKTPTPGSGPAILAADLTKTFTVPVKSSGLAGGFKALFRPERKTITAVRQVSFQVEEGESVAFLGPNGAGKSTTIKMLSGLLHQDGGTCRVLGLDPRKDRRRLAMEIGSVFGQKSQLWFHLPPADSFRLLGAVYEIDPRILAARTGELVERFSLGDLMTVPVRKLSLGQRIRCELAASLLHKPRLLFLDEPTIGLDVVVKKEIRSLLEEWNRDEKVTLFLTSHDIGDVEKICRRAILIHHGTLVLDESVKDLKHQASAKKIVGVKYHHPVDFSRLNLEPAKKHPDSARFEVDTRRHSLQTLMKHLVDLGEVEDLTVEDEPLEDLLADLYRSKTKEEAHGLVHL